MRVIVVGNGAPASVLVPHKVGGIGKNQIRAGVGELPQFLHAIAVYNAVGFVVRNRLLGLGQSPFQGGGLTVFVCFHGSFFAASAARFGLSPFTKKPASQGGQMGAPAKGAPRRIPVKRGGRVEGDR